MLLLRQQMVKDRSAWHCMKNAYSFTIYYVVHNFNRVTLSIKTDKQILVFLLTFIKPAVLFCGVKSPQNVIHGNLMIESGIIKLNNRIHVWIITEMKRQNKLNRLLKQKFIYSLCGVYGLSVLGNLFFVEANKLLEGFGENNFFYVFSVFYCLAGILLWKSGTGHIRTGQHAGN
jgi:hypothetical protein